MTSRSRLRSLNHSGVSIVHWSWNKYVTPWLILGYSSFTLVLSTRLCCNCIFNWPVTVRCVWWYCVIGPVGSSATQVILDEWYSSLTSLCLIVACLLIVSAVLMAPLLSIAFSLRQRKEGRCTLSFLRTGVSESSLQYINPLMHKVAKMVAYNNGVRRHTGVTHGF